MTAVRKLAVIGNGMAGARAVEEILARDRAQSCSRMELDGACFRSSVTCASC
ncbi:MAG: hypothetical protein ACRD0K_04190 [Egibacteraceae bacterium]